MRHIPVELPDRPEPHAPRFRALPLLLGLFCLVLAACGVAPAPTPATVPQTATPVKASSHVNSEPLSTAFNLYADGSVFKLNLPASVPDGSQWTIEPADLGQLRGSGRQGEYVLPSGLNTERVVTLYFSVPGAKGGFERSLQLHLKPQAFKPQGIQPGPAGSTYCADEGQVCTFTGTKLIAYGANGTYAFRGATNTVDCNNLVFGDPLNGVVKACFVTDQVLPTGPANTTFCAFENQFCGSATPHTVSYGAQGTFTTFNSNGVFTCNNDAFADPLPGVVKACFLSANEVQPTGPNMRRGEGYHQNVE